MAASSLSVSVSLLNPRGRRSAAVILPSSDERWPGGSAVGGLSQQQSAACAAK